MAVDKKSDHVGNHGGRYTDNDGMSKQFTYIDHDKKTKIGTGKMTKKEIEKLKKDISEATERTIEKILAMPAVNVLRNPWGLYEEFVIRSTTEGIIWDENVVRSSIKINPELGHTLFNQVWKRTVKEQHWFDDMSHEDILAEKWRELM